MQSPNFFVFKQAEIFGAEEKEFVCWHALPNAYIMLFLLWAGLDLEHDSRSGRGGVFGSGYKP